MNNLSLILYFADVLENLQELLGWVFGITMFVSMTAYSMCLGPWATDCRDTEDPIKIRLRKASVKTFIISFFFVLVAVMIPKSSTMYMMAASETGEELVKNPDAQEILGDVTQIIKKKLKQQLQDLEPRK